MNPIKNNEGVIKMLTDYLLSLSANELATLAFLLGYFTAQPLTTNEQNSLGNFLLLYGQELVTFAAQNSYLDNTVNPSSVSQ